MNACDYVIGSFVWMCFSIVLCIIYIKTVICSWIITQLNSALNTATDTSPIPVQLNMTKLVSDYRFREETHDISGVKIHCVVKDAAPASAGATDTSAVLVFIHGTASASVTFFDTMKALPPTVKCIALDLPIFGISGHVDISRYSTNEQMCIAYADMIGHTLHRMEVLEQTILVAHSLGGFLSIYVADRFPIKKLVLLNPAGILPTLGVWGYYWAIFFKSGLPTADLPFVSRDGVLDLCNILIHGWTSDPHSTAEFWLYFYKNPANEGHRILQRLITLNPCYSYWNTPAITTLMDVYRKVPTSVCFGVEDTICPSHIGSFLRRLTNGEIMTHSMRDASHNPCENVEKMVDWLTKNVIHHAEKYQSVRPRTALTRSKCRGYSYLSFERTQESFERVYNYLLTNTTCYPLHSA